MTARPTANAPVASSRLVIGVQPVREALRVHGALVRDLSVLADAPRLAGLCKLATAMGVEPRQCSRGTLDKLAQGGQHQGVVAHAPPLQLWALSELFTADTTLAVALDGIVDPQNFGAVVRSAVGLAQAPVLWPESASAPLTPATFRASAGAIEHARLCRVSSLVGALTQAVERGYSVVGLDGQADQLLANIDLSGPVVIAVGSEAKGLGKAVRRTCTALGRLSMSKSIDSLNASVAVAIALYEAQRQRTPSIQ